MDNYYFTNAYSLLADNAQDGETIVSFDLQNKILEGEIFLTEEESTSQNNTRSTEMPMNDATPSIRETNMPIPSTPLTTTGGY